MQPARGLWQQFALRRGGQPLGFGGEIGVQHLAGHPAGGRGGAVLDENGDGDFRVFKGSVADKGAVVRAGLGDLGGACFIR